MLYYQAHEDPDLKELLELPDDELIDLTRKAYSLGAEVYNFFANDMKNMYPLEMLIDDLQDLTIDS